MDNRFFVFSTLFVLVCMLAESKSSEIGRRIPTLSPTINPADYDFNQTFKDGIYTLYWKLDQAQSILHLAIDCHPCAGWVAFGVGTLMVPADIMFGYVDPAGIPIVGDYMITQRDGTCPGVCPDTDPNIGGEDNILDYGGNNNNGTVQIKWSRKLDTGDTLGDFVIGNTGTDVIWGYNPTDPGPTIIGHDFDTKGVANINFFTGATSITANVGALYIAHGALMFIAWGIIVPIASFVARYLKVLPCWFHFHRSINGLGMFVAILAFVIGVAMVTVHFDTYHKIIGLIVTILGTAQPIIGMLADHFFDPDRKSAPIWPDKIHWVIGWGTLILAMINVLLGLIVYNAADGMIYAYIAFFVVVWLFLVIFFIFRLCKPASGGH